MAGSADDGQQGLLVDSRLLGAYTALHNAAKADPALGHEIRCPVLCMAGVQSSGKTSWIETLVGFPVGYTKRETATRCPVRYILRSGPGKPHFKVGNKPVAKNEDIRTEVGRHMDALAATKHKFSHEVLDVEIVQEASIELDIIDLPGLKDKKEEDYDSIAQIVAKFLNDPEVIPVVICKADASHQTQTDVDALEAVGLRSTAALVIVNYFNKQIPELHEVADLNNYCKGYMAKFTNVRFVCLHITEGMNKEKLQFAELAEYYGNLPRAEMDFVHQRIRKMEQNAPLDPKVSEALGVRSAVKFMQALLHKWVAEHGKDVLKTLQARKEQLEEAMKSTQEFIDSQQPAEYQKLLQHYVLDYEKVMAAIHCCTQCHVKTVKPRSRYASRHQWAFTMDQTAAGGVAIATTFEEELGWLKRFDGQPPLLGWKSLDKLSEELMHTYTGSLLDLRLHTHKAMERLQHLVCYMIVTYPDREYTLEEILSKAGWSNSGMTHSVNKHKVMKELVVERLFDLQDILEGAALHIEELYTSPLPKVQELLKDVHPLVAQHDAFPKMLEEKFTKLLQEQLEQAVKQMQDCIDEVTRFVGVDLNTRLMAIVALVPLRQDILRDDPTEAFVKEGEQLFKNAEVGGNIGKFIRRSVDSFTNLVRNPQVADREANDSVPQRVKARRAAIMHLKQTFYEHGPSLAPIDFVEGGLQELVPEDYQSINVEEFNKDAKQYAWILKCLIALQVEVKIQRYVFEPFYQNQLLTDMTKAMLAEVDEMAKKGDDGEPSKLEKILENADVEDIKRQHNEQRSRLDAVSSAADELRRALGHAAASSQPALRAAPQQTAADPQPARRATVTEQITFPAMTQQLRVDQKTYFLDCCKRDLARILGMHVISVEMVSNVQGLPMTLGVKVAIAACDAASLAERLDGKELDRAGEWYATQFRLQQGDAVGLCRAGRSTASSTVGAAAGGSNPIRGQGSGRSDAVQAARQNCEGAISGVGVPPPPPPPLPLPPPQATAAAAAAAQPRVPPAVTDDAGGWTGLEGAEDGEAF